MKSRLTRFLAALTAALFLIPTSAVALDLDDARWLLENYYVEEIPDEILSLGSLEEILAALGDPYTGYYSAEEMAAFYSGVDGNALIGIGISTSPYIEEDGLLILSVIPNTPAAEAGLTAGDYILSVDGLTLTPSMDPSGIIGGEEGTQVALNVLKRDSGKTVTLVLTRRYFEVPIVTYGLVDGTPVVVADSFGASTASVTEQALERYPDWTGAWIYDLRSNPGGTSTAAADTAGLFLGNGKLIAYFEGAHLYDTLSTSRFQQDLTDNPIIILTNEYSASAAELFSAAIRDYDAGIAIGQRTYGKGVAQVVFDSSVYPELFDDDGLKITVYYFYSPSGTTNHTVGVLPTLTISNENSSNVALLLGDEPPKQASGYWQLALAGYDFYISREKALSSEYRSAFCELLEALPPSAVLSQGSGSNTWTVTSAAKIAADASLALNSRAFTDTEDSFAHNAISLLAVHDLVSGYNDGTFRPEETITRAEFCALLCNAFNLNARFTSAVPFSDVAPGQWFYGAVSTMYEKGLISGYEDGTFHPNATITGQELVSILSNALRWLHKDGRSFHDMTYSQTQLSQYSDYAVWARKAALILDRYGALDLQQSAQTAATRASAAQLLCSYMSALDLLWE